ncbi:MAG: AAA family ATPase [Candidatus Pacebacteria bacterium]|jgi:chromosome segregation protein|nr:AAA family ATPase [Candidatus Paceibacterota bacterium]|tara:strand:+ start:883 stop:3147 length:2265 start_codon:yes stop_codon:yes gene_type:complete
MYLKSLELSGFKSFAKKSIFDFTSDISGIVGPNGSGKSNVAEAFSFALGEQSIKSLRGKRGEDLIFNGSKAIPRSNRASVKVVFDNNKRFLDIDFDEVTVERSVHRDSINQYFINGSQVRLRDVVELLASANIGSSGHHIISQGEADRILNANIKERKEMIEDALGLKVYQYKKQESARKLEKTEENIAQVESLRKEIAPHIKFLKKQVDKVEKSIAMRDELKKLSLAYLKRESEYISHKKAQIEKEKKNPQEELNNLEKKLEKAKEILSNKDMSDEKSEELISIEKGLADIRSEKDALMRDLGRFEGQIAFEERRIEKEKKTQKELESRTVNYNELNEIAQKVYSQIDEAHRQDDLSEIKNTLERIGSIIKDFISTTFSREKGTEVDENELKILRNKKVKLDEKLSEVSENESSYNKKYSALKREIEKDKDDSREAEREIFSIMSHQNKLRSTLNILKSTENEIAHNSEDFERELQEVVALIGRTVLDYDKFDLGLSTEEIINEERNIQGERRRKIEKIKIRLEEFGGGSGEDVIKEYKEVTQRDEFLEREVADLEKSAESLKDLIKDLENKLNTQFKNGIEKINKEFQKFFELMFGGGTAFLSVIKEKKRKRISTDEDILNYADIEDEIPEEEEQEGIEINVSLPHKRIKGLVMLSGGERALTSIALLFAMSQVNPPPFLVLDETDAALDEANSKRYGDMIENLSKFSQLILITHNRETMSRAGVLYGVTMGADGISKLLSVKFEEAVHIAK